MPAKSWTAKYFPDARARLVVHFGFEMGDEALVIPSRSDLQFLRPN